MTATKDAIRTVLLDADGIAYRTAAWAQGNQGDGYEVLNRIKTYIGDILASCHAEKCIGLFSCPRDENFRRDYYPLYKTNRTQDPPDYLSLATAITEKCCDRVLRVPRLEADDLCGILATNGKVLNPIIVSEDKDLRSIPGWHLNPTKEDFPVHVTENEADYAFCMQWLTGDSQDGYGGIKGCGPKKAIKILSGGRDLSEWQSAVEEAYLAAGMTLAQCYAQARCARILRSEDYDAETKTVRPWMALYEQEKENGTIS